MVVLTSQQSQNYFKMGTPETAREPYPDRILDDIGGAFGMGAVGGSLFHFLKGAYNSPGGSRFLGGSQPERAAGRGQLCCLGRPFFCFDCSMVYLREKEDPWNSIIAGAATGGFLSMRQGVGASGRSALVGGVLLSLVEGAGIMLNKAFSEQQNVPIMIQEPAPAPALASASISLPGGGSGQSVRDPSCSNSSSSSWFRGWFGGGKKEETGSGGIKTVILECFDAPPVPSFEFK